MTKSSELNINEEYKDDGARRKKMKIVADSILIQKTSSYISSGS